MGRREARKERRKDKGTERSDTKEKKDKGLLRGYKRHAL